MFTAHSSNLPQHADVQGEGDYGDGTKHDQLGGPAPRAVELVEGRAVDGPDCALPGLGANVPENSLRQRQEERRAHYSRDDFGGARRFGKLFTGERSVDGYEALHSEGEYEEDRGVLSRHL